MTTRRDNIRRFGGRWVREGDQYKDRFRVARAILGRFWYLLVPFLGIMYAHDSFVRPVVEDIKSTKNQETKALLDAQDDIRAEVSTIQTETQTVSAEIDTLYLPQVRLYSAINDSLISIRSVYDQTLPDTEAKLDSLRSERNLVRADVDRLSGTYRERSRTLQDLQVWQATLQDSVTVLDHRIALKTDELYREMHPELFQRKEAVVTGQGVYPRRDQNPPRGGRD